MYCGRWRGRTRGTRPAAPLAVGTGPPPVFQPGQTIINFCSFHGVDAPGKKQKGTTEALGMNRVLQLCLRLRIKWPARVSALTARGR